MDQTCHSTATLIASGCEVRLHLEIRFENGFEALSTFGEEPIRCRIGDGSFTPAFEALIQGLAEGAETRITADGSELFGAYEERNLHWVDSADFPTDQRPVAGQLVAFATPSGEDTSGIIITQQDQHVLVDFNHPFSGRRLLIRIQMLDVD